MPHIRVAALGTALMVAGLAFVWHDGRKTSVESSVRARATTDAPPLKTFVVARATSVHANNRVAHRRRRAPGVAARIVTDVPQLPPVAIMGDGTMARRAKPALAYIENVSYTPAPLVIEVKPAVDRVAPSVAVGPATTITSGDLYWLTGWFAARRVDGRSWTYVVNWGGGALDSTSVTTSDQGAIAASHRYLAAGTYTLTLNVTEKNGGPTGTASTTVSVRRMSVGLDIAPGDDANVINLSDTSHVELSVAVLSSPTFDPRLVDVGTIRIGDAVVARDADGKYKSALQDVNGDVVPDLVVRFRLGDLKTAGGLTAGSTSLSLLATLTDGRQIVGADVVKPR